MHPARFIHHGFFALAALMLLACSRTPPEQALRDAVAKMEVAISARDASAFMQHVSASFKGSSPETGELDRDSARRVLTATLLMHPNIKIGTTIRALNIVSDSSADMTVEAFAASGTNALPDSARHFTFDLRWTREGGDWKVVRAQWGS